MDGQMKHLGVKPVFSVYSSDWDYVGSSPGREMRNGEYSPICLLSILIGRIV